MWRIAWQKTTGPVLVAATTTAYWAAASTNSNSNSNRTTPGTSSSARHTPPPPSRLDDTMQHTATSSCTEDNKTTTLNPTPLRSISWALTRVLAVGTFSQAVVTQCEAVPSKTDENNNDNKEQYNLDPSAAPTVDDLKNDDDEDENVVHDKQGFQPAAKGDFHGLFPTRQLWHPAVEYPLWDGNWDGKHPPSTGDEHTDRQTMRSIRKHGVTRHIICIRHGQYDETHKEDGKRVLTALGRHQAALTGQRLAALLDVDVPIKAIYVSDMARAKETASIIASYLPNMVVEDSDPLLNEGRPCHHIPGGRASPKTISTTDDNHGRIETAFQKYFYRADFNTSAATEATNANDPSHHHEVEIIVCHANVIRYFLCRALQLPPEAWLRFCPFNCSITYFTIRPTGTVSCRMVGDIGHLPYETSTFSTHEGYLW